MNKLERKIEILEEIIKDAFYQTGYSNGTLKSELANLEVEEEDPDVNISKHPLSYRDFTMTDKIDSEEEKPVKSEPILQECKQCGNKTYKELHCSECGKVKYY